MGALINYLINIYNTGAAPLIHSETPEKHCSQKTIYKINQGVSSSAYNVLTATPANARRAAAQQCAVYHTNTSCLPGLQIYIKVGSVVDIYCFTVGNILRRN